jgi:hypothetical protein
MSICRQLCYLLFLPLFGSLCAGCATLLRPTEPNQLTVQSEPDSAYIYVNGIYKAVTPATFSLPAEERYIVKVQKQGYRPAYDTITTSVAPGWLIADIVFSIPFFAVPIAVDGLNGNWYTIDDKDSKRSLRLVPGKTIILPPPVLPPADTSEKQFSLSLGVGVVFPAYQVPVLPQSYELGFGYAPSSSLQILASAGFDGTGILYQKPNNDGSTSTMDASALLFSGIVGVRTYLFETNLYATGGIGALHAYTPEFPASAPSLQPLVSLGVGYTFPGDTFFMELRRVFVLTELDLGTARRNRMTIHHTSLRVGVMQLF